MAQETPHWTSESIETFIHRITFDFITKIAKHLEAKPLTQAELAKRLNLSEGAVSQVLNTPRNLTLKTVVKYARAVGLKIALVAYDDGDPENRRGPINSEIFTACWENVGRPQDFHQLNTMTATNLAHSNLPFERGYIIDGNYVNTERSSISSGDSITKKIILETLSESAVTDNLSYRRGGR